MSKLTIILKLLPAIKDTLFGGLKLSFYLKKNKAITMLLLALTITFFGFFYIYEQAVMHGAVSKNLQNAKKVEVMVDKAEPSN